jgi:uncharacterized protein
VAWDFLQTFVNIFRNTRLLQMQTPRPTLVVSIHDVSPLTWAATKEILHDLREVGVDRTSLLVIPDHHHKAMIGEDKPFCQWVRDLQNAGHEVVLHGYYHKRPKKDVSFFQALITEHYTAGEGEFFDLTEVQARVRLEKAKAEFSEQGLQPTGFIAPAWLLGQEAEMAVRKAGFTYTTRLQNFKDLNSGREDASQSLVWSVRSGWRRVVSLKWNAYLAGKLTSNPLFRVGLHPPDWKYPAIKGQILELVRQAAKGRVVGTYQEWQQSAGEINNL